MPPAAADKLSKDWWINARDEQLPPEGSWTYWTACAGRGWGKTRAGAEWTLETARRNPGTVGHLIAPTHSDLHRVMLYGPSGIMTIASDFRPRYIGGDKQELRFPNGTVARLFSAEKPDRLRGPACNWAWADELAAWARMQATWDQLQFGYREKPLLGCFITTTPRPLPLIKQLTIDWVRSGKAVVTRGSTFENRANLSGEFFENVVSRYEGTRLGRQELNAEILGDVPGALWNLDQLDKLRISLEDTERITLKRIVVAIDPPATSGEDADECGIVAAGIGNDRRGYVLADRSSHRDSPMQWAKRAVDLYHELKADRIVAEVNNGGEMVSTIIRQIDKNVPIRTVHASRGKVTRAEPISALYEQGRVSHVGALPKLEDQMISFTPDIDRDAMGSPDRVDALVWCLTDLMLGHLTNNSIAAPKSVPLSAPQQG